MAGIYSRPTARMMTAMDEIIGRKIGMTQVFNDQGQVVPVTVIEAGPCVVVGKRSVARDGYNGVSLGFEVMPEKQVTKPYKGQFTEGVSPRRVVREVRMADTEALKVGDEIRASIFNPGDVVDVSGLSKGRGFQGVVKRHGFAGGPETHGSNFHRRPGSIGSSADPSRVFRGMKMPGRMGGKKITVKNLDVVRVDAEKNLVLLRGAVPGARGSYVTIRRIGAVTGA